MYTLSETFDDPRGRWDQLAPWDGTENSDSAKGFLSTQTHVDLRSFRNIADLIPVPQTTLDAEAQTVLDAETQTSMEEQLGVNKATENWTLSVATGLNAITVGKIASRGGWSGLQTTTTGAAVAATLVSSIPNDNIDISWCQDISIIFPDYHTFDGTSAVTLTSDPNGAFGTGHDSVAVAFSANASVMPQLLLPIASFAQAGFDNTKVTGVKVVLNVAAAPAAGQTVTIMAIRGVVNGWTESWLDFDTRLGAICRPVTLTGNAYVGTVAQDFEFIRGDGTKNDPIPADTAMNMYFYPGGGTSPNDATGGTYNYIAVLLRETKDTSGGLGSHLEVGLSFNDAGTTLKAMMRNTSGGSPATTTTDTGAYTVSVGGALSSLNHYLFRVQVRGTQIYATLYETLVDHTILSLVWQIPITLTNSAYTYRNGRVGFIASLISRDAYVEALDVAPTGFAELVTQVYPSRTPVDGAQLAAVCASDINLFSSVTGSDVIIDQTKTISGSGSYRTAIGVTTNTFIVDDWTQTYLDVSIWVPSSVTLLNQPVITLNTDTGSENIAIDKLQPAQWNTVHVDLGVFRNLITGSGYSLSINAASTPDKPLGYFWIDGITIGRRRVAWSVRATQNGQYREFKDMLNNPFGAVHFTPDERGSYLQLKAVALTEDAWVSSFKLFPRYANLGLPVYDQGFET